MGRWLDLRSSKRFETLRSLLLVAGFTCDDILNALMAGDAGAK